MTADTDQAEKTGLFRSPIGLYDFQADGVAQTYVQIVDTDLPAVNVLYDMGLGKQSPVSEPVLTPSGWVPIGDIRPGDEVISATDGLPTRVLGVYPQVSRETYRVTFNDGSWTRCGPDHLWTVAQWINGRRLEWSTLSLAQIMEAGIKDGSGNNRWMIPMTHPVQGRPQDLPVDPYALGVILGDGSVNSMGYVSITSDEEILTGLAPDAELAHHRSKGVSVLNTNRWAQGLLDLGLDHKRSHEKFVPEVYLRATEADRKALLAGLLDTDGSPIQDGGVEFTSTSLALAEAVVELAESLGGTARWKRHGRVTTYTHEGQRKEGRRSWRVNVKVPFNPFRLERKAQAWVEPTKYPVRRRIVDVTRVEDEDSVCIKIDRPDGLYLTRSHIVTHNTVISLATIAMLIEDGLIDNVIVVVEQNKLRDWADEDFAKFVPDVPVKRFDGPPARRRKILEDPPTALVMTWEVARNEIARFKPGSKRAVAGPGPLAEWMRDRRVLIIWDECTRLKNRTSRLYVAWEYLLLRYLPKYGKHRPGVIFLTGTKVEKSPEDHFNVNRLVAPEMSPSVAEFHRDYVAAYDQWDPRKPVKFRNLTAEGCEPGVIPLAERWAPITLRKRKTDPDVIDFFPARVENPPTFVPLGDQHMEFYNAVCEILDEEAREAELSGLRPQKMLVTLRQIANAPESLLHSEGRLAREIVEVVGAQALIRMGSAKIDAALDWLHRAGDQQAVIFTFFGQSVLPLVQRRLEREGFTVSINHGQMSSAARQASQAAFKAGDTQVFLSSDAGRRGLNLGCGSALLHLDLPILYADYVQRCDRIHRIDSKHPSVTIDSLVALDTVDEAAMRVMLQRNKWSDQIQDHDLTVEDTDGGMEILTGEIRELLWESVRRSASRV